MTAVFQISNIYLNKKSSDHDSHQSCDILLHMLGDDGETAHGVDLEGGLVWVDAEDALAAVLDVLDTAGVGDREAGHGEGRVLPVQIGLGPAARQLNIIVNCDS